MTSPCIYSGSSKRNKERENGNEKGLLDAGRDAQQDRGHDRSKDRGNESSKDRLTRGERPSSKSWDRYGRDIYGDHTPKTTANDIDAFELSSGEPSSGINSGSSALQLNSGEAGVNGGSGESGPTLGIGDADLLLREYGKAKKMIAKLIAKRQIIIDRLQELVPLPLPGQERESPSISKEAKQIIMKAKKKLDKVDLINYT